MSLKIPNVGKAIKKFDYSVGSNSAGNVIVSISYCDDINAQKYKFLELRCDERFKNAELIISKISECLLAAKSGKNIKIREDKDRDYVFFNDYQFTGAVLSKK